MKKNKNVLLVAPYTLFPANSGGSIYLTRCQKELSKYYNYHALLFANSDQIKEFTKPGIKEQYFETFKSVHIVRKPAIPFEKNLPNNIIHFLKHIILGLPLMDCSYFSFEAIKAAKNIIKDNNIKMLECHQLQTSYLRKFVNIPSILVYQNIESNLFPFWNLSKNEPIFYRAIWKLFGKISRFNAKNIELKNSLRFKQLHFISEVDKSSILNFNGAECVTRIFPININTEKKKFNKPIKEITWIGGFDWEPNKEAALWFTKYIYPELKKLIIYSKLHFNFVGKSPPLELKKISNKNISVYGFVENIDEIWEKTDCFIVPLLSGSGIRIKILESLSKGIPIISTSKGCEGLSLLDDKNILIANTPKEFCYQLLKIYYDQNLAENISRKAKIFITTNQNKEHYKYIYKKMNKLFK